MHLFQHEPDLPAGLGRKVDPCALVGIDCLPVQRRLIPRPITCGSHVPQNPLEVLGHGRPVAAGAPAPQPPGSTTWIGRPGTRIADSCSPCGAPPTSATGLGGRSASRSGVRPPAPSGRSCSAFSSATLRSRSQASSQSEIRCASTAAARISFGSFSSALLQELTYAVPWRGSCPTPSCSPVTNAAISGRATGPGSCRRALVQAGHPCRCRLPRRAAGAGGRRPRCWGAGAPRGGRRLGRRLRRTERRGHVRQVEDREEDAEALDDAGAQLPWYAQDWLTIDAAYAVEPTAAGRVDGGGLDLGTRPRACSLLAQLRVGRRAEPRPRRRACATFASMASVQQAALRTPEDAPCRTARSAESISGDACGRRRTRLSSCPQSTSVPAPQTGNARRPTYAVRRTLRR